MVARNSSSGSPPEQSLPAFLAQPQASRQQKFVDLEWSQRERLAQGMVSDASKSKWARLSGEEITHRNRYSNIDPFAHNRVKLQVADSDEESDYINASPILLKCHKSGTEKHYIATQGPKDVSLAHFYMMLWHETADPAVIVMLTQTHEAGREKCHQYYPVADSDGRSGSQPLEVSCGSFSARIELVSTTFDDATRSTVRELRMQSAGKSKRVVHFLFEGWPDFSVPEGDDRRALLRLVRRTARTAGEGIDKDPTSRPQNNPRVIHCSAGVGRSGTFIALDYLLTELEEGGLDTSDDRIADCVDDLRSQRMMMVQGEAQFHFLYDILKAQWLEKHGAAR